MRTSRKSCDLLNKKTEKETYSQTAPCHEDAFPIRFKLNRGYLSQKRGYTLGRALLRSSSYGDSFRMESPTKLHDENLDAKNNNQNAGDQNLLCKFLKRFKLPSCYSGNKEDLSSLTQKDSNGFVEIPLNESDAASRELLPPPPPTPARPVTPVDPHELCLERVKRGVTADKREQVEKLAQVLQDGCQQNRKFHHHINTCDSGDPGGKPQTSTEGGDLGPVKVEGAISPAIVEGVISPKNVAHDVPSPVTHDVPGPVESDVPGPVETDMPGPEKIAGDMPAPVEAPCSPDMKLNRSLDPSEVLCTSGLNEADYSVGEKSELAPVDANNGNTPVADLIVPLPDASLKAVEEVVPAPISVTRSRGLKIAPRPPETSCQTLSCGPESMGSRDPSRSDGEQSPPGGPSRHDGSCSYPGGSQSVRVESPPSSTVTGERLNVGDLNTDDEVFIAPPANFKDPDVCPDPALCASSSPPSEAPVAAPPSEQMGAGVPPSQLAAANKNDRAPPEVSEVDKRPRLVDHGAFDSTPARHKAVE